MVSKLLTTIPLIIMMVLADVAICFTMGAFVGLQLLSMGHSQNVSVAAAIISAVGTFCYLRFNHLIRAYIKGAVK
jgi:phosphate starvation-inducible membrane PsiE